MDDLASPHPAQKFRVTHGFGESARVVAQAGSVTC